MRTIIRWYWFSVLGALSGAGCGGIGGLGGADQASSNNDAPAASTAGRVVESTPFPESELWILGSDTTTGRSNLAYLSMSGVGDLLFGLEVTTDVLTGAGCSVESILPAGIPIDPSAPPDERNASFSFDGQTMQVRAEGSDPASGAPCLLEFTVIVARQGAAQVLFGMNVFDVTVLGQPTLNGQPVTFAPLQLNRIRRSQPIPCEDPTMSLEGLSWSLGNLDTSSTPFPPIPRDEAELAELAVLNLYGSSDEIDGFELTVGIEGTSCFGGTGTISFDGRTLVIEAQSGDFAIPDRDEPPIPEPTSFLTDNYESEPLCNDTCVFGRDGQCDDARPGAASGRCAPGTDCSDCGPMEGMDPACNNSCLFSRDGICEDGRDGIETLICPPGTDCDDCGPMDTADASPASFARLFSPKRAPNRQVRPGDPGGTCTFSFTGTVAECGIFLPPILVGGSASASESIRIEGTGRYTTSDGRTGEVNTLYLRPERGFGGGCGLGMIPMLPFLALGLLGFRFRAGRRNA